MVFLPYIIGKKIGKTMSFKNKILILFFFVPSILFASEVNLKKKHISLKDFIILKFDLFFQENKKNIYSSRGAMVSYQNLEQEVKIDKNDKIEIKIYAFMDRKRYLSKKYYPKLKDCEQVRNKLFANKFGYSFFRQKKNESIDSEILYESIIDGVLDISNLNDEIKKKILSNTNIQINVIHPKLEKNVSCEGNILDKDLSLI